MSKKNILSKLALVAIFVCISVTAVAQQRVTVQLRNASLRQLFTAIEKQTDYRFSYRDVNIDSRRDITIDMTNVPVTEVLDAAFKNRPLRYNVVSDKSITILEKQTGVQAGSKRTVVGRVTDSNGEPLPGAGVVEKGTGNGAATDVDGNYIIEVKGDNPVLVFSFVGFADIEAPVSGQIVNVTMDSSTNNLNELVFTALGMKRAEKILSYATQSVKGEDLQTVKGASMGTSMTGRVSGLAVYNSTEFGKEPTLSLRGGTPLLVLNGVPTYLTLTDINADDVESMTVLKGATATALYGSRGGNGAIMITTKKGGAEGFHVSVNSSTMIFAGNLALPEVQHSYSSGYGGKYNTDDEVWGDKLDIGRTAKQYNPVTYEWEEQELTSKGKNNLKNFTQFSFTTDNTVSVSQQGRNGSFYSSINFNHIKGQYPNENGNGVKYSLGGTAKIGDKVTIEGSMGFTNKGFSNISGIGYGTQGYIYNMLVWMGSEWDVRDYRDYWIVPNEKQNWMRTSWYDNPWMMAYEKIERTNNSKFNGMASLKWQILPWMRLIVRGGYEWRDYATTKRAPLGINSNRDFGSSSKGFYSENADRRFSTTDDAIIQIEKSFGDFSIDALAGGSIYYWNQRKIAAETVGGISVPGFYSIKASVGTPKITPTRENQEVQSLYGQLTFGWKNAVWLDLTGRNDWSSTMPANASSYFYPSVGLSWIVSELIPMPSWLDFWKLRASWAVSKNDLDIYDTSMDYSIDTPAWGSLNSAYYPTSMLGDVKPVTDRTYEVGTRVDFLNGRISLDATYYNKLNYNNTSETTISAMSGFTSVLMNTDLQYVRRGFEFTVKATPVVTSDFEWNIQTNWAKSNRYYAKIDEEYTSKHPWVYVGARADWKSTKEFTYDPDGNIINNSSGFPIKSNYETKIGNTDPDWVWGLMNTFRYKNLSLSIALDGRIGGMSESTTNYRMWQTGVHTGTDNKWRYEEVVNGKQTFVAPGVVVVSGSATYDEFGNILTDDRVFAPNDKVVSYETYIKKYWVKNMALFNYDETFFKIREVALTYKIPSVFCKKIGMNATTVSLIGQNLLLWCKEYRNSDPDVASDNLNSPSVRYIGVDLKFDF